VRIAFLNLGGGRSVRRGLSLLAVATLVGGAPAFAESTGCVTVSHGALDVSTRTTVMRLYNYGGDFDAGETLNFMTNSGTLSVALSRTRFGLPAEFYSWTGAGSTSYAVRKSDSYSFHLTLTAVPFDTATLAVTCTAPPAALAAPPQ
jgi:hypothetical protein